MEAEKLSKAIYDKAKALGATAIILEFSGGSDEGYLNVGLSTADGKSVDNPDFEKEIDEWAWSVYDYSGAGDGNDYGDDVVYDLAENKVTTSEWTMIRHDGDEEGSELVVADAVPEDDSE